MNIYFDTEFTGLVPNTTLISLGCITEYGEKFYAEFTDFDESLCDDWIKENVIKNLYLKKDPNSVSALVKYDSRTRDAYVKGDSRQVLKYFKVWLEDLEGRYPNDTKRIQFVSDVCHYDFYLLCNLFGGAFSLPEYVNPVCYDICQDICPRVVKDGEFLWYADMDDMYTAFDISREEVCKKVSGKLPEGKKHNSLYDAEVIKAIYEGMRK